MASNLFASHNTSGISLTPAAGATISPTPHASSSSTISLSKPVSKPISTLKQQQNQHKPAQAPQHHDVVIIGSGPAGYTAAIYLGRAGYKPSILGGELQPGGQLTTTTEVENFPGFPDGVQGPDLMERMKQQALKFDTTISNLDVTSVERFAETGVDGIGTSNTVNHNSISADIPSARPHGDGPDTFTLRTSNGEVHTARAVVIATGSHHRKLGVPGEAEYSGHGVSYCATCDGFFFKGKPIAVIGGGDSALTEALFLAKFGSQVTIVHRRDHFRASQALIDRVSAEPKISVEWNSTVVSVNGDGKAASGLTLRNVTTGETSELPASGIFVAIGTEPNSAFLHGLVETDPRGYITVNGASTKTSVPGIFAAGDVVDPIYQQAISAAGMGCRAALDAQEWLESR